MSKIGVAIIGCGGITLQNHLPGLALIPDTEVVALCDADEKVLEKAKQTTGVKVATRDYQEILKRDDVHAVIIATPNFVHAPMAIEAAKQGKHIFCEKPIAMNFPESVEMYRAAEAKKVRHMTAFTYRFVPAMRYMKHLVNAGAIGQPFHFRSCRLQDWGHRSIGWRQVAKLAGSGELGDMLSHRIDYAHMLLGGMTRLVANTRRFHEYRSGQPSDLEDWVAIISDFENGSTGVLESTKVATGRGESAHSQDYVEVNGNEGTIVFQLENPQQLQVTNRGDRSLRTIPVPQEYLKWPGSPRDPLAGDPLFVFRYDQNFEFIDAIRNQRPCIPSFYDGAMAQGVMDAALQSAAAKSWVDLSNLKKDLKKPT
ncbi:MAG: Gfo/Idh/MocA family protein [Verrucomicrobiales bacterium]